jgi:hypothetical protein
MNRRLATAVEVTINRLGRSSNRGLTFSADRFNVNGDRIGCPIDYAIRGVNDWQVQRICLPTQISCPTIHLRIRQFGLAARSGEARVANGVGAVEKDNPDEGEMSPLSRCADE